MASAPALPQNTHEPAAEWLRTLLDALDDAVFVHDADGRILEVNAAACRRLEYSRPEFLQLTTRDIDAPEFARGFAERTQTQLAQGAFRCEGIHRARSGRLIPVDINTSTIVLGGRPAVLAVMRDITQRKQTEETLAKQSQLLQSILDNLGDAIIAADAQGQIFLHNPAAERLFGPGLAQSDFELFADERGDAATGESPLARSARGNSFDDEEWFIRHAQAPQGLWMRANARPLRDTRGAVRGGVLVCHDITERKKVERRLQAQYAVSQAIAGGGALSELSATILSALASGLNVDVGVLWVFDGKEQTLYCEDVWHCLQGDVRELVTLTRRMSLPAGSEAPGQVCIQGAALALELPEPSGNRFSRHELAWAEGLRGVAAFPILSNQDVVGVLEFFGRSVLPLDDDLLSMMSAMGSQIGQMLKRERVERALRDSEALYQSLVQSLPQNIFRKDRSGRVTFGNQHYCATLKLPLDQLLGKTDYDLFPKELAQKYTSDDRNVMETGTPFEAVEEHHLPDGTNIFVQVVKTPVYDAQGEIVGIQGIFWDVTEKARAAEVLANSERRYRELTEATLDAIILADQRAQIILFNPAAERMFGFTAAEMLGKPVTALIPES
jgi:PAS domain S-box-containing protein